MNEHSHTPVAIITGCSSGIGRATAVLLAERGWHVFATARRLEALNDLSSDRITPLRLDVTDEQSITNAVEQMLAQAGCIDALVNNAGYTEVGPLEEATAGEIRRQFETNTFGPLRLAQLVIPAMRAQGSGRIVNVSTIGGRVAIPFIGLYNSSKFALEAMSDALRLEARPFGVQVIVIEPGGVRTNFNAAAAERGQRFAADASSPYHRYFEPLNRFITQTAAYSSPPERVARVIHRALTARRPRARYAATPDARIMLAIMTRLSDGMRDAIWGRLLGL
ncbi:MAG: SDR family oxidoreductase [Chloroflexota bacterium]